MTITTPTITDLAARLGLPWQQHQEEALTDATEQVRQGAQLRLCLYHATGKGKTYTSLAAVALAGAQEVLVLAPPVTHLAWAEAGRLLGLNVVPYSHAKFRQKGFKVHRDQAMIVDEFHLLGGHTGKGWKKLDRIAAGLQAPLVIASATPNYNDAERVYCIKHVLDPTSCKGGYIEWLYQECETRQNAFGMEPLVEGFKGGISAEEYLSKMPRVHYVEDEVIKQVSIADVPVAVDHLVDEALFLYGLDRRRGRIVASQMEGRHALKRHRILGDDGLIRTEVYEEISRLVGDVSTPTLIYCDSSTIAEALFDTVDEHHGNAILVTGKVTQAQKARRVELFKRGSADVLIGTATLATGTDGVDKMCDHLLIVDDTDDDSLRRQLMGRILPRGLDTDASQKVFTRLTYS